MSMTTKADKQRFDKLHRIGCIACRREGRYSQIDVHHIVDRGYRKHSGGNKATLPLCPYHHRGVWNNGCSLSQIELLYGPSLALNKRAFVAKYGSERELLAEVDQLICI